MGDFSTNFGWGSVFFGDELGCLFFGVEFFLFVGVVGAFFSSKFCLVIVGSGLVLF
jgi:hypothetical protein